jgi:hypothetical protein
MDIFFVKHSMSPSLGPRVSCFFVKHSISPSLGPRVSCKCWTAEAICGPALGIVQPVVSSPQLTLPAPSEPLRASGSPLGSVERGRSEARIPYLTECLPGAQAASPMRQSPAKLPHLGSAMAHYGPPYRL